MHAQWRDMAGRKTYVTGGVGAHHMDEAFGDAFELPPDRCYGETCAAIASVLWNWRMLLVTGEARFADLLERTLYNGVLAGLALDGGGYSYVNPLHVREGHRDPVERGARRQPWYACACCPPNVMRLLASLQRYVATRDDDGVQIHQYTSGTFGPVRVRTDYPWDGTRRGRGARARAAGRSACASRRGAAARLDGEPVEPGLRERDARLAGRRHGDARARHDAARRRPASAHRRGARLPGDRARAARLLRRGRRRARRRRSSTTCGSTRRARARSSARISSAGSSPSRPTARTQPADAWSWPYAAEPARTARGPSAARRPVQPLGQSRRRRDARLDSARLT